jgi:hypothetical protein
MSFLRRLRGRTDGGASRQRPEVTAVYTDMRDAVLNLDPSSVGIHQGPAARTVWGLVMDWTLDRDVATIVSLADGTTSLYLSSGGGSIGAGEHPGAAAASVNAVRVAERMIDDVPGAMDSAVPPRGRTALTLLTFSGLRRFEDDNVAFENGTSRLSPVADSMQEVIDEIRRAEAAESGE